MNMEQMLMYALSIIGILALIYVLVKIFQILWRIIWPYVLARPKNLEALAGKGSWALVTGCTDGIGRAYCEELASRGFNLVLVSRTASKLAQMEEEFRRRFQKPDYITIPFDFTETSVEAYRTKLLSKIKHLEIGILGRCGEDRKCH
jgi:17beta-estradiol 17-dehydrogenase / very-long-chain 3-oxoacyl-CoA reductase